MRTLPHLTALIQTPAWLTALASLACSGNGENANGATGGTAGASGTAGSTGGSVVSMGGSAGSTAGTGATGGSAGNSQGGSAGDSQGGSAGDSQGGSAGALGTDDCPGLQPGAAWPMRGRCANHAARSPASGVSTSPAITWTYLAGMFGSPSSPTIDRDGTLYISTGSDLRALSPDGTEKWATPIQSLVGAPAIGPDGTLFAASFSSNGFCAVDPSGTVRWTLDTGPLRSPALGSNGSIYVVTGSTLIALDATGGILWQATDLGTLDSEPAVGADGTVFVANAYPTNRVYAFTPSGERKWDADTGGGVLEPPLVAVDGSVYVSTTAGVAVFSADGAPKWTHAGIRYAALGADGTLYGGQNQLFAIDPSGAERWAVTAYLARTPLVDASGNVYVMSGTAASSSGTLTSYDSNGVVRWTLQTPFGDHQALVMGADGTIYVATSNMFEGRGDGGLLLAIH